MKPNLLILGTGAYATALATVLSDKFNKITMYGINLNEINDINHHHLNSYYYPNIELEKNIFATNQTNHELFDAIDYVIIALPTEVIEGVFQEKIIPYLTKPLVWINSSKGFNHKYSLQVDYLEQIIPKQFIRGVYKIIGATFGIEMMEKLPSKLTMVSKSFPKDDALIMLLTSKYLKMEWSDNFEMVNYFSVFKNIYAILQGFLDGMGYKKNTQIFLMMDSLKELISIMGFDALNYDDLFMSANLGDFILTGTSIKSRNYTFGKVLASGINIEEFLKTKTIEGVNSLKTLKKMNPNLIKTHRLLRILDAIIFNNKDPKEEITAIV